MESRVTRSDSGIHRVHLAAPTASTSNATAAMVSGTILRLFDDDGGASGDSLIQRSCSAMSCADSHRSSGFLATLSRMMSFNAAGSRGSSCTGGTGVFSRSLLTTRGGVPE